MENQKNLKGFTLIEILIVIGLIAILAAITIIALNPTENFQSARDSRRRSEVAQIANSINAWMVGSDAGTIGELSIPTCPESLASTNQLAIPSLPATPRGEIFGSAPIPGDPDGSHYFICGTATSFTVVAPEGESGVISVTR